MTLDPKILAEAQDVLRLYSRPAQEAIKLNLYGPREARFAGAIVAKSFTVEVHHEPTETDTIKTLRKDSWAMMQRLCKLLARTTTIIEDRLAIGDDIRILLDECASAEMTAEEDFSVEPEEKKP